MNSSSYRPFAPRLLAGFVLLALLASIGLFASRPAHTAGGPVPVTVTNSPLYAVTRASDDPAQQPVSVSIDLQSIDVNLYTVPVGKRLVIEYLSATANSFSDRNAYNFLLSVTQGGQSQRANFNMLQDGAPFSATSQNVRLYADAGTVVDIIAYSDGKNDTDVLFTLIGHLVDVPLQTQLLRPK